MSHQTGIRSNEKLRQKMTEAKQHDSEIRMLKVRITKAEELTLDDGTLDSSDPDASSKRSEYPVKSEWQVDYRQYVTKAIVPKEPCYLFFRMDNKDSSGYHQWAFILYSPQDGTVRNKMLYASTKSTLKNDFGTGILYDYFADSYDAIQFDSFNGWLRDKQHRNPGDDKADQDQEDDGSGQVGDFFIASDSQQKLWTALEDERHKVKAMEFKLSLEHNAEKKSSNFQFPIRPDAINALLDFRDGRIVHLKLRVNLANEEIQLSHKSTKSQHPILASELDILDETHSEKQLLPKPPLPSAAGPAVRVSNMRFNLLNNNDYSGEGGIPPADPCDTSNTGFHLFSFTHLDLERNRTQKTLFAYVMSTEETPIRERIAYSACLNSLFDSIANRISIVIDKRLEVDDEADLTVGYVAGKLYPELDAVKKSSQSSDSANSQQADSQPLKFTKPKPPPGRGPRRIIK